MSLSICFLAFKWLGFVNFVQDIVLPLRNLNLLFNERFSLGNFIYNIIFTNSCYTLDTSSFGFIIKAVTDIS